VLVVQAREQLHLRHELAHALLRPQGQALDGHPQSRPQHGAVHAPKPAPPPARPGRLKLCVAAWSSSKANTRAPAAPVRGAAECSMLSAPAFPSAKRTHQEQVEARSWRQGSRGRGAAKGAEAGEQRREQRQAEASACGGSACGLNQACPWTLPGAVAGGVAGRTLDLSAAPLR